MLPDLSREKQEIVKHYNASERVKIATWLKDSEIRTNNNGRLIIIWPLEFCTKKVKYEWGNIWPGLRKYIHAVKNQPITSFKANTRPVSLHKEETLQEDGKDSESLPKELMEDCVF